MTDDKFLAHGLEVVDKTTETANAEPSKIRRLCEDTPTLIVELGCEDLPAEMLKEFSGFFGSLMRRSLKEANLLLSDKEKEAQPPFCEEEINIFYTPRRLAVQIKKLMHYCILPAFSKRGPSISSAFDLDKKPTPACLGFLRANQAKLSDLVEKEGYVWINIPEKIEFTTELLPKLLSDVVDQLVKNQKTMRWHNGEHAFIRPVTWLMVLYGRQVIDMSLFGLKAGNQTYGHRFYHPEAITLENADGYEKLLWDHKVRLEQYAHEWSEDEPVGREKTIYDAAREIADDLRGEKDKPKNPFHTGLAGSPIPGCALIIEVLSCMTEWPVVLTGKFDERFLALPKEFLTHTLAKHQKIMTIENKQKELLPAFITVSNIIDHSGAVIRGNERVVHARLSDTEFFYQADKAIPLSSFAKKLKDLVFHEKLGSVYDKTLRMVRLLEQIAPQLGEQDTQLAQQAAKLCKADLMTQIVGEFPEFQGIAGYHYALHEGFPKAVAQAIREHYQPASVFCNVPESLLGQALSLVDSIDTLIGMFGIYQIPSGDKDPLALRRAAYAVVRILLGLEKSESAAEKLGEVHLLHLLQASYESYPRLPNTQAVQQVFDFILERLIHPKDAYTRVRICVQGKHYPRDVDLSEQRVMAIKAKGFSTFEEFKRKAIALDHFLLFGQISAEQMTYLIHAYNRRITPLLEQQSAKYDLTAISDNFRVGLLVEDAEKNLANKHDELKPIIETLLRKKDYCEVFNNLLQLEPLITRFFEEVMVNSDNEQLKINRLALLAKIKILLNSVVDLSYL